MVETSGQEGLVVWGGTGKGVCSRVSAVSPSLDSAACWYEDRADLKSLEMSSGSP